MCHDCTEVVGEQINYCLFILCWKIFMLIALLNVGQSQASYFYSSCVDVQLRKPHPDSSSELHTDVRLTFYLPLSCTWSPTFESQICYYLFLLSA